MLIEVRFWNRGGWDVSYIASEEIANTFIRGLMNVGFTPEVRRLTIAEFMRL